MTRIVFSEERNEAHASVEGQRSLDPRGILNAAVVGGRIHSFSIMPGSVSISGRFDAALRSVIADVEETLAENIVKPFLVLP